MKNLMKQFKRSIVVLVMIALLFNVVIGAMPVMAAEVTTVTSANLVEVKSLLTTAMTTGSTTTYNISNYRMKLYEFVKAYFAITKQETIAYNTYYNLSYGYTVDSSGYVTTFWLKNVDSGFKARYSEMQNAVNKILGGISNDMTDLEKVVYIHDYLAYNAQYDLSTNVSISSYWPYGVMVKKVGVCDSYSKAFVMLMDKLGIMSEYVLSTSMDHSWAVVKLGDYYYHLDTTWDDPILDTLGRVNHEFLLRTDSEFVNGLSHDHYDWYNGWSSSKKATDTTFTNWEIHSVRSRLIYSNGDWYYVDSTNSFVKSDIFGNNKTVIVNGGSSYGQAIYSVEAYNGGWLFTQSNKLMYCDYDGSNISEVLESAPTVDSSNAIRYLHMSENNVLTTTTYNYTDANDFNTFLSKNVLTYQLGEIIELINENKNAIVEPVKESVPEESNIDLTGGLTNGSGLSDSSSTINDEVDQPFTKLEYIEGTTKNNSIDTGYFANSNTGISLDMAMTGTNLYGDYINGYNSSVNRLVFRQEGSGGIYVAYGWYNSSVHKPVIFEKFNVSQLGALTYINGKLVRTSSKQTFQMTNTLKIGISMSRIYGCKIWEGDQLVRDLVPVKDNQGIACLYDIVNNKFYYGIGSYTAGQTITEVDTEAEVIVEEVPAEVIVEVPVAVPTEVLAEVPVAVPAEVPAAVPAEVPAEVPVAVPAEVPAAVLVEVPTEVQTEAPSIPEQVYSVVGFIEVTKSSGGIDTGYFANSNTAISLDMAILDSNIYANFIDGYNSSINKLTFRQEATKGLFVAYGWYNSSVYKPVVLEQFNISQLGELTYINGALVRRATKQTYQMTNTLKIGTGKSRIYGCKIWDRDQLVRDFIPVLDSTGVACLYEQVAGVYYYFGSSVGYGN